MVWKRTILTYTSFDTRVWHQTSLKHIYIHQCTTFRKSETQGPQPRTLAQKQLFKRFGMHRKVRDRSLSSRDSSYGKTRIGAAQSTALLSWPPSRSASLTLRRRILSSLSVAHSISCINVEWLRSIPDSASSSVNPRPDVRMLANDETSESLGEFGIPCGNVR